MNSIHLSISSSKILDITQNLLFGQLTNRSHPTTIDVSHQGPTWSIKHESHLSPTYDFANEPNHSFGDSATRLYTFECRLLILYAYDLLLLNSKRTCILKYFYVYEN